jgi:translation initiation factor IF-3
LTSFCNWLKEENTISNKKARINKDIRATEVRLIDDQGEQLGIVSIAEALEKAQASGLDLVEISPNAKPPVCKMMDYEKYRFQQIKKKKEAKKQQKRGQTKLKRLRIRPGIEEGDYQVKLRNLMRFLKDGDRVEISLRFRGREIAHKELGMELLKRIQTDIAEYADIEREPKFEGRQMMMVVVPKKSS